MKTEIRSEGKFAGKTVKSLDMARAFWSAFIISSALVLPPQSHAELAYSGRPQMALADSTYDEVTALKLVNAKVVWVNKSFFKREGYNTESADGLQIVQQKVKDEFAFLIPTKNTPSTLFENIKKKFYPDRYGGPGLNGNLGSGRAASLGDFQLKGLGPTSMVGAHADLDHASGGVGATQAIAEAIWSEILDRETPHRSNLVVALIDTGLTEPLQKGIVQPRYLVVRQDPLRPAHFIANPSQMSEDKQARDATRTAENIALVQGLMARHHALDATHTSLNDTFPIFAEKVAAQWAYLHANLIHHGAVSPSNIDVSGAMLDLSSVSTLKNAMLAMAHDPLPFGDAALLDRYLLRPFYDAVVESGKGGLTIPYNVIHARFKKAYEAHYRIEILKLTGLRPELAEKMAKEESGRRVFDRIEMLRNAGHTEKVATSATVPVKAGDYEASKIIAILGGSSSALADGTFSPLAFEALLLDKSLRAQIQLEFSDYFRQVYAEASAMGFNSRELAREISANSAELNRERSQLRRNLFTYISKAARAVISRFAPLNLQTWIDEQIESNGQHLKAGAAAQTPAQIEKSRQRRALSCPKAFAS
jgi:hypothetical protein